MRPATTALVDVLGAVADATDAADGFLPDHTRRATLLATRLAEASGGGPDLVRDVLHGSMIRHLGCTGFATEEAHRYGAGDDVALRRTMALVDFADPADAIGRIHGGFAPDAQAADREAGIGALLAAGPAAEAAHHAAQCDAAERLVALLPVSTGAASVASDAFERWDGHGGPRGLAGDEISLVARVVEVAYVAELLRGREGRDAAIAGLQRRAGRALDPDLVAVLLADIDLHLAAVVDAPEAVDELLRGAEPPPAVGVDGDSLDAVTLALGRFADLKSTWFLGHAEAVADLAGWVATELGCDEATLALIRRSALAHDIGRVAIPSGTWDAPRALSRLERTRVEGHAAESARILDQGGDLAACAAVAGATHERLDASGYPRGSGAGDTPLAARILAAADVAVALAEERPHRHALDPAAAREVLVAEVRSGRLDAAAVDAVLSRAGRGLDRGDRWPDRLTDREVEVLRLVARGAANKEVATALGITAKTAAHHVAHIYDKIGCRSRAGAALYAVEHGVVGPGA